MPRRADDWPRYTRSFYNRNRVLAQASAREIVPFLVELLHPKSVVDVGCGTGTWLAVFAEKGVTDAWGLDREWVDRESLEFPPERFAPADLRRPFSLGRTFDLAVCLEVAENIPADAEDVFLNNLTSLAPVVLFSSAVPFQGGVDPVNNRWPDHWVDSFRRRRYVAFDCIRFRFWANPRVAWWYSQNSFLFVRDDRLASDPSLKSILDEPPEEILALVHPGNYLEAADPRHISFRRIRQAVLARLRPGPPRDGNP